jgi:hypothetical protein
MDGNSPLQFFCPVEHDLDLRSGSCGRRFTDLRQTEVQDLHFSIGCDFDVCWFQVAMNHTFFVCGFQGFGDLPRNAQRCFKGNRAPRDAFRERFTTDQFQYQELGLVLRGEIIDGGDVRMIQRCKNFRLTLKTGSGGHDWWRARPAGF